jgi:hypothetical protein
MSTFISNITINAVFGTSQDRVAVVNASDERAAAARYLASWHLASLHLAMMQACHALARRLRGLKRHVKPVVTGAVAILEPMCSTTRRQPCWQPVRLASPPRS